MLFVETKSLTYGVAALARNRVLQELHQRDLTPLIRSARLRCYEALLTSPDRINELEDALNSWSGSVATQFVRGDVFCFDDYVLFLVFEDEKDVSSIKSGIIFSANTPEPFRKLDSFCETVRQIVTQIQHYDLESSDLPGWTEGKASVPEGFRSFVAKQDVDSLYTSLRKESMTKRIVAASKLEDAGARVFLRTARDAHLEGYAAKLLAGNSTPYEFSIERLEDVGLVEREVQVSCRKTGHALFRLPNAHALAVVTVSDATCSECGAPVADENVQEVLAPTQLASSLLEDGSWLISRLHFLLREMGVPEREIALGPSEGTGYGQMMANICSESFLIVTRDGDLTPAFARWSIDLELETAASHLVIVATGRIHNEAGVLLRNHARHRISGGQDFEMILADDVATAGREFAAALERVSQRVIAEQLCTLDDDIGLNVSRLVLTKFQLSESSVADNDPVVVEPEPDFAAPNRVLRLAAHASMHTNVLEVDAPVSNLSSNEEFDPNETTDIETPMSQPNFGAAVPFD